MIKSLLVLILLARAASAEPAWQLRPITTQHLVQPDSALAVFRDRQGNVDLAATTLLAARYQVTEHWAPTLQLGLIGNNAPGAALDGAAFANPSVGATYTRLAGLRRYALAAALVLPIGSGGGARPDPRAARANVAASTARPFDEPLFEANYATASLGGDLGYAGHGFTAQLGATLLQSARVRGADTAAAADPARTRATLGVSIGRSLGRRVSLGAALQYRRWLSQPEMLAATSDPRLPNAERDLLAVTAGVRVHLRIGAASLHPGVAYTRGFDGASLHAPMNPTAQPNAVTLVVPVLF